jgi:hypothetical protein
MIAAITFNGCKKGDTGPAGTAGTNGVANISNSVVTVYPADWQNIGTGYWGVGINNSNIVSATNDAVFGYMQLPTSSVTAFIALPTSNMLAGGDQVLYSYSAGKFQLYYQYATAPTTSIQIKMVVIPPAGRLANPNVNYKNYEEVKKVFNLKD